jgi:hypothetical protein
LIYRAGPFAFEPHARHAGFGMGALDERVAQIGDVLRDRLQQAGAHLRLQLAVRRESGARGLAGLRKLPGRRVVKNRFEGRACGGVSGAKGACRRMPGVGRRTVAVGRQGHGHG